MEYSEDKDTFFTETEVELDEVPDEPESEEPVLPADVPEMKAQQREEALAEAQERAEQYPSKETPDADELERAESAARVGVDPSEFKKNPSASEQKGGDGDVESDEAPETSGGNSIVAEIEDGTSDATILSKYTRDDLRNLAEELGISTEGGTKQSLLADIKAAVLK